jgi:carbamoyl-phosphate synthase large subunit
MNNSASHSASAASRLRVMIAGIGGASLGTEIYKCLKLAGTYDIYGCDVSATAYGLYDGGFAKTYRVNRDDYVNSVIAACRDAGTEWLVPGGEQPMTLLGAAADKLAQANIKLLANDSGVIALFSDKDATFKRLAENGVTIPRTVAINAASDLEVTGLPCIVKPATGSGGSASVFFAVTADEAMIYAEFIRRNGSQPIAQEYVDIAEGEFTIGVLSLPNQQVVGSIALKRDLNAKLSVAYRGRGGIVSSGYSQGHIGEYPGLCQQAEKIAAAIGSRGPINIQARVRNGVLLPFEINPRFSASTYLRAMAGFNEIDILLRYLSSGTPPVRPSIRPGWYMRSLTEQFVAEEQLL